MGIEIFEQVAGAAWDKHEAEKKQQEAQRKIDLSDPRVATLHAHPVRLKSFIVLSKKWIREDQEFLDSYDHHTETDEITTANRALARMGKAYRKDFGKYMIPFELTGIELLALENLERPPQQGDYEEMVRYTGAKMLLNQLQDEYIRPDTIKKLPGKPLDGVRKLAQKARQRFGKQK